MDHIVYLDAKAHEMDRILDGSKTMVIRGAQERTHPYGRVGIGDRLFFVRDNGEGLVRVTAKVTLVHNFADLSAAVSRSIVENHQSKLQLTPQNLKRCAGKPYLVLVEFDHVEAIAPFRVFRHDWAHSDDWVVIDNIELLAAPR